MGWSGGGRTSALASEGDRSQARIEGVEIGGVGGDDRLLGSASADDHVNVSDVFGAAGGQEPADMRGVDPV